MSEEQFDEQLRALFRAATEKTHAGTDLVTRVLANARAQDPVVVVPLRRRRAWLAPLLAAAAVALVVGGTVAAIRFTGAEVVPPATHQPRPPVGRIPSTAAVPSPTPTLTPTSSRARSASTSTKPTTSTPTVRTGSGRWTGARVVITERSLGAVIRGMSLAQARAAAGVALTSPGDGIYEPADRARTGATRLTFSWAATCFDGTRRSSGPGTTVTTPAGVRLGDRMSRVGSVYPQARAFTADPSWTGPGNIPAGLLVPFKDGVLLFIGSSPDRRGGTITSIRGAPDARTASSTLC